jgi:HK97 family phage prohead protease
MEEKRIKYNSHSAKSVDEDKRVLRMIGSTEDLDRDGEIVKASGWKLENYKKNPVVLANHQHRDLPVAKATKVWVEDKKLMFDIEFPEADVHPQGDTLYKLYKGGFMNATSVGFIPNMRKAEFGQKEGDPNIIFKEQELLEISLVSVPANANALMTNKGIKKAIKDEVVDELEVLDLENFLKEVAEEDSKNLEKDEKTEEKNEEKLISDTSISNDNEDINKNRKMFCGDCGIEIHLCSTCFEKKESEDFFRKVYESLINDK